jgi:hypothetical protein
LEFKYTNALFAFPFRVLILFFVFVQLSFSTGVEHIFIVPQIESTFDLTLDLHVRTSEYTSPAFYSSPDPFFSFFFLVYFSQHARLFHTASHGQQFHETLRTRQDWNLFFSRLSHSRIPPPSHPTAQAFFISTVIPQANNQLANGIKLPTNVTEYLLNPIAVMDSGFLHFETDFKSPSKK